MALGIGPNTAIFSVMDAILWQTLPVRDAGELVLLDWVAKEGVRIRNLDGWIDRTPEGSESTSFKYPSFERFRQGRKGPY